MIAGSSAAVPTTFSTTPPAAWRKIMAERVSCFAPRATANASPSGRQLIGSGRPPTLPAEREKVTRVGEPPAPPRRDPGQPTTRPRMPLLHQPLAPLLQIMRVDQRLRPVLGQERVEGNLAVADQALELVLRQAPGAALRRQPFGRVGRVGRALGGQRRHRPGLVGLAQHAGAGVCEAKPGLRAEVLAEAGFAVLERLRQVGRRGVADLERLTPAAHASAPTTLVT